MLNIKSTFSGFSVSNIDEARKFYQDILGLDVEDQMNGLVIRNPSGSQTFIYHKDDHTPATYTMFNVVVNDITEAHKDLISKGIVFEKYPNSHQDENGIMWGKKVNMGPNIAWFQDPSGNIISIIIKGDFR
jgi:catechol 2,3-dioxygenase-like lactoylglutathione lyase family enzyme